MNTHRTKFTFVSSLAVALALSATPITTAQNPDSSSQLKIERVTPQSDSFALGRITGKPVRGADQEQFGTVEDFLVDPQSGRVHFAVVPSGSNTFRLVPMVALQPGSGTEGINLSIDRARWEQVGTMVAPRLEGRVTIDAQHQQRLASEFGIPVEGAAGQALVRASTLKDRELRSPTGTIGLVEDVVIDFHNKIAAPIVRVAGGLVAAEERFLVPFDRLQLSDDRGAITTNLARNDFFQVQGQLTPTGYPSQHQAFQPAANAASAIQHALQNDASLQGSNVQVVPESRIVLRGTVDSEQKKAEIERRAREAAGGTRVDSEIMVRRW